MNIKEWKRNYYLKNKEKIKARANLYYKNNKDRVLKNFKKYRTKNKKKLSLSQKEYYQKNKIKLKQKMKQYREFNKEKIYKGRNKKNRNKWLKNKRKKDILFNLKISCRNRTLRFLKSRNLTKKLKFSEYIGCSTIELKIHLEKQFTEGMTWENQGKWHIDHIIPLSSAKTEEQIYKLLHYTNLQPLWAKDNIKKASKIS